jgi:hypothetical protein
MDLNPKLHAPVPMKILCNHIQHPRTSIERVPEPNDFHEIAGVPGFPSQRCQTSLLQHNNVQLTFEEL